MNKELITDKEVLINESESWAEEEVIFLKND